MKRTAIAILFVALVLTAGRVDAHPGSGIVVDRQGNVYFVDTGSGVWKLGWDGKLTRLSAPAYHWMAIDHDGLLKNAALPNFSSGGAVVTRAGSDPTILLSSDFPVTVARDGALYYPWARDEDHLQVFRLDSSGTTKVFATLSSSSDSIPLRWVNGAVAGPDGSLYYTEDAAVRKINPQGEISTIVTRVSVSGCTSIPGMEKADGPYLRGIDVDSQGSVYVAASGCGAVLKITADKTVTTVLRSSSPWSPTGVAISGKDLYVLEYLHTPGDDRREWVPRVRKVSHDGRIDTVATIERP